MTMIYEEMKVMSLNVNGLGNPVKIAKVMSKVKKDKIRDFNVVLDHNLDTTSKNRGKMNMSRLVNKTLEEMGYFDVWRDIHLLERDYSHYSATHSVYSRIDYFYMQKEDRHKVKECQIGVTDVSDHSAIYLTVYSKGRKRNKLWRLNVGLLNNETVTDQIKTGIQNYLEENDNGETAPIFLWDALKAVMRGKLIAITSGLKKTNIARYQSLQTELKMTEHRHKESPEDNTKQQLKEIRHKINVLLQQEVEMKTRYLKQTYYVVC